MFFCQGPVILFSISTCNFTLNCFRPPHFLILLLGVYLVACILSTLKLLSVALVSCATSACSEALRGSHSLLVLYSFCSRPRATDFDGFFWKFQLHMQLLTSHFGHDAVGFVVLEGFGSDSSLSSSPSPSPSPSCSLWPWPLPALSPLPSPSPPLPLSSHSPST
jgi:hypothetical protein